MNEDKAVREAGLAFKSAIDDAVASGYRVNWPGNAAALDKIEISSSANVAEQLEKLPQPLDPKRRRPAVFSPHPTDGVTAKDT
jgi:hypothetical protein